MVHCEKGEGGFQKSTTWSVQNVRVPSNVCENGGGGIVEGGDEALEKASPVVVMLVRERMFWETGRSGARENMCSRETVGGASLGSRGEGAGCSVRFRPGGEGERWVSLVHEGGGVANAMEPGGVEMSSGSGKGTCGEARGARLGERWTTDIRSALAPRNGSSTGERGILAMVVSEVATEVAGSAAFSSIAASGDPLPFLRRDVDGSCRLFDASEVPRPHPMPIVTLGRSSPGASTSFGEGGRHPREIDETVSQKISRSR